MIKDLVIKVSNIVVIPYDEGLLDGLVNKNHLMYIANAEIQRRGFDPTRAIYEYFLQEQKKGERLKETKL